MKLVTAVIQPFKLEQVQNALTQIGVSGMTITEVEGFGNQKGHNETDRDAVYAVGFVPKVEIEVAVPANLVENVIDVILRSARTGEIGDGKIFVTDIDHATRIRTGENDDAAL
jgi:nitrogen regulatory protein P-II 2